MNVTRPCGILNVAENLTLTRMGCGAMQLAGPNVFGPPKDRRPAVAVLREAVRIGITHIDTSDFYGPYVVNELIREALAPYPDDLHIVTKVGAVRGDDGSWMPEVTRVGLIAAVHSSTAVRRMGSPTHRSSRSAGSPRCRRTSSTGWPLASERHPPQTALAWLLQRSPTIVLIPGTSSVGHLKDNVAAADLKLPAGAVAELDDIAGRPTHAPLG